MQGCKDQCKNILNIKKSDKNNLTNIYSCNPDFQQVHFSGLKIYDFAN